MKVPFLSSIVLSSSMVCVLSTLCVGQASSTPGKNNPYSPSPSGRSSVQSARIDRSSDTYSQPQRPDVERVAFVVKGDPAVTSKATSPAPTRMDTAPAAELPARAPTETYLIGVGDVLIINLKNSPNGTGRYVVRDDGTIDFALAGNAVPVRRKTVEEVAAMLRSSVRLFTNPQVDVKVVEYRSHTVAVSGLADNTGEKSLRREAMPLFTLRAEAEVSRDAKRVAITRAGTETVETYDLDAPTTDGVLILPGDSVEFLAAASAKTAAAEHFFLNGAVASPGKKEFVRSLTLSKAIAAAGGGDGLKRATIKRSNGKGDVIATEYDIKAIRGGKAMDPLLAPGDVVEVRN